MKNIIIVIFLMISAATFSQEDRRAVVNGEEVIVHTVKAKETLYGLTQKYNVSKKEIRGASDGMLIFIKVGQELNIPVPLSERTFHIVKAGETLYGISKKYGVSVDQLTKLNPTKAANLKKGDKLNLKGTVSEKTPVVENKPKVVTELNTKEYTVAKKETLYGIAKKFNTNVNELQRLNPQLGTELKVGEKIRVPYIDGKEEVKVVLDPKVIKGDKPLKRIEYTVKGGETLYGISRKYGTSVESIQKLNPGVTTLKAGDKLNIDLPEGYNEDIKVVLGDPKTPDADFSKVNKINPLKDNLNDMVKKESYTVSMFLPLMLDKNDRMPQEVNKSKKINSYTEMSVHFYQGAALALDSAKASGVSIDLNVYDTENDTSTVGKYLRSTEVKSSDIIIGPFYEKPYSQVAQFSKANGIQAVCPVTQSNKLLFNNKNVTTLRTSLPTQISYLASYLSYARNTENVICLSGKSKKEKYLSNLFSERYNKFIEGKTNNYRASASTHNLTSYSSLHGFDLKLVKGKKNIIIIPILDEAMASAFFTQLTVLMSRSKMRGYEIEIFSLENMLDYHDINVDSKMRFNLHVLTSSFIDYKDEKVKEFVRKYRAAYGTEPTKYAFMGFDVAFYHALALNSFGKNYPAYYNQVQVPLLQTNYVLKQSESNSGYENQSVYILKYQDYDLVRVK